MLEHLNLLALEVYVEKVAYKIMVTLSWRLFQENLNLVQTKAMSYPIDLQIGTSIYFLNTFINILEIAFVRSKTIFSKNVYKKYLLVLSWRL